MDMNNEKYPAISDINNVNAISSQPAQKYVGSVTHPQNAGILNAAHNSDAPEIQALQQGKPAGKNPFRFFNKILNINKHEAPKPELKFKLENEIIRSELIEENAEEVGPEVDELDPEPAIQEERVTSEGVLLPLGIQINGIKDLKSKMCPKVRLHLVSEDSDPVMLFTTESSEVNLI